MQSDNEFEKASIENGGVFWYESDLMQMLGYQDVNNFRRLINNAMHTCAATNIMIEDHFIMTKNEKTGKVEKKLSRFACYLIVTHADSRKQQVAAAKTYLAYFGATIHQMIFEKEQLERINTREEIKTEQKLLGGIAKDAGVTVYALFQNSGYMGLYNKSMRELKKYKGLPENAEILDFMGNTELAANLFRISQTRLKISKERIRGQQATERAAFDVGREVRITMQRITDTKPEDLPIEQNINEVKKSIKQTNKELRKLDQKKKEKSIKKLEEQE